MNYVITALVSLTLMNSLFTVFPVRCMEEYREEYRVNSTNSLKESRTGTRDATTSNFPHTPLLQKAALMEEPSLLGGSQGVQVGSENTFASYASALKGGAFSTINHSGGVTAVAVVPTTRKTLIVVGSNDGKAYIWDIKANTADEDDLSFNYSDCETPIFSATRGGKSLRLLKGHTGPVSSVAVSPDGFTVLTGSSDKKVCLWQTSTGELLHTLKGHVGVFSPDGTAVLTGSSDKRAYLWDTETGTLRKVLKGHTGSVTMVAFSADGQAVIT
ncbi:hypothetical protein H0W26_03195, partial [Candidatus Dependentiae bacterium]|nr:hypothetical protein [Candidatus Dependentiae bacterium]